MSEQVRQVVSDDAERDLQLSLPSTKGVDELTSIAGGQGSLNMASSDRTLDARGQLHNPPGINRPISPNVFPLGIERAIYDVLVSEGEANGDRWGAREDVCAQEWAGKIVQQLLFTEEEPRSVVTSDNLVLWFRESYSQGLWRLDDVGRI